MKFLKSVGIIFWLLLFSSFFLSAEEPSLDQLNIILGKLETELLNSKDLLNKQEIQLSDLKTSLEISTQTIVSLKTSIQSLRNNIAILEGTIQQLKTEISLSKSQTQEVSVSLREAEKSLKRFKLKNKVIIAVLSVVTLGLIGFIIRNYVEGN